MALKYVSVESCIDGKSPKLLFLLCTLRFISVYFDQPRVNASSHTLCTLGIKAVIILPLESLVIETDIRMLLDKFHFFFSLRVQSEFVPKILRKRRLAQHNCLWIRFYHKCLRCECKLLRPISETVFSLADVYMTQSCWVQLMSGSF